MWTQTPYIYATKTTSHCHDSELPIQATNMMHKDT